MGPGSNPSAEIRICVAMSVLGLWSQAAALEPGCCRFI